ncbi:Spore coat protein CotF [Amphibacillus marinus]|uniref:Spore coat protein CotF n=1 Tax=Amphibacillus marinus TaxID=872970 RepID=A0A1H8RX04_9BACI|nr:spore coat protein [Amphibacillus marinus]SEO70910.1 Spore coat protein CotF [Amphibacillus marinus]
MQQNKVQNPETQIEKTAQLNDRDIINDLLASEKYMTDAYCTALNEASNQTLYQTVLQIFTETQNQQRNLYNLMFKNGWYSLDKADAQQINQTVQQFSGYMNQFPVH